MVFGTHRRNHCCSTVSCILLKSARDIKFDWLIENATSTESCSSWTCSPASLEKVQFQSSPVQSWITLKHLSSVCDSQQHPRQSWQLSLSHFRLPSQSHLHRQQWLMRCCFSGWRPTEFWTESSLVGQSVLTPNRINKVGPVVQRAHLKCCLPDLGAVWNVKYYGMWACWRS